MHDSRSLSPGKLFDYKHLCHWPAFSLQETAIDRVVHHSVILDLMQVRSFRIQQATGQQAPEPAVRS